MRFRCGGAENCESDMRIEKRAEGIVYAKKCYLLPRESRMRIVLCVCNCVFGIATILAFSPTLQQSEIYVRIPHGRDFSFRFVYSPFWYIKSRK